MMLVADTYDTALVTGFILVSVMAVIGIVAVLKAAIHLLFPARGRPRT